ncbi:CDP-glycerol glycerophosphotransferase [Spirochaetia bacterium]|nr:CDP-glycerol glycerophosphotransferase [Spirochaetia bacterium]
MKIIYLFFFALFLNFPTYGYIDPGTGSMLFSLLTGAAVTIFFFLKNFIIRIRGGGLFQKKIVPGKKMGLVIYSEGKQYWNVFKPIVDELARRNIPFAYYSSGEDDPGLSSETPLMEKKFIGKGNDAYRFLNFLEADVCLTTTPSLDVFQFKRSPGVSHYAHILHMVNDATTYRLFGLDYYDSVLLTGEYQKKDIRQLEKQRGLKEKELFVAGCTYLDELAARKLVISNDDNEKSKNKTVLIAPSWGKNGILSRYGLKLLLPLAKSSWCIIVRPHPQSMIAEKETVSKLREMLVPYQNVEWNFDTENIYALSRADVLISDFSGIVFDFAFLFNRPLLYPRFDFDKRPYDLADIEDEAWNFRALRQLGIPLDERKFEEIEKFLDEELTGWENRKEVTEKLREEAWQYRGMAGKRAADFLLEMMGKIKEVV